MARESALIFLSETAISAYMLFSSAGCAMLILGPQLLKKAEVPPQWAEQTAGGGDDLS
jgi:hypothetical protein